MSLNPSSGRILETDETTGDNFIISTTEIVTVTNWDVSMSGGGNLVLTDDVSDDSAHIYHDGLDLRTTLEVWFEPNHVFNIDGGSAPTAGEIFPVKKIEYLDVEPPQTYSRDSVTNSPVWVNFAGKSPGESPVIVLFEESGVNLQTAEIQVSCTGQRADTTVTQETGVYELWIEANFGTSVTNLTYVLQERGYTNV